MRESDDEGDSSEPQQLVLMRRLVELSMQRSDLARERTRLSHERTAASGQRTEMSSQRTYLNAERTLSVWVRTALAAMVVGIAIDRFGLFTSQHHTPRIGPDTTSTWIGAAMVAFGVLIAVITGARFQRYATAYRKGNEPPAQHGPFVGSFFALLTAVFGVVLFILLLGTL